MIETLKQIVIEGEPSMRNRPSPLSQSPDKEALYKAAHQITRHFMEINSIPAPSSMPKAGIAARTVNGVRSPDIITQLSPCIPLLPAEECVHQALHNRQQGIERFGLVTSGKRLSDGEIRKLTETVRYIKQASDIKCCASLGLLNKEQLKNCVKAVSKTIIAISKPLLPLPNPMYHSYNRAETRNNSYGTRRRFPHLFRRYHRHGETMEQRIEMALLLQKEQVHSIP